ncbi:MAG: sigma-54 dependent transcriptional regulator [Deltaproteobacteria bacterium]|nr:sigma-54 dependent transcriptional regulator [Deltaproteobacteria bacterium]
MTARVLIADDEASLRKVLAAALKREGCDVVTVKNGEEALEVLEASTAPDTGEPFSLVITDVRMPGIDGMTLLSKIKKRFKDLPVVMLTAHGTVDLAVQALKQGAFDFVTKPYERDELVAVVKKALAYRDRDEREPSLSLSLSSGVNIDDERTLVGNSARIRSVIDVIDKVADSPSTVLITGESGTGKELVALALHRKSKRCDKPFIRINAAAIPPTLIEAELFGHEKGAFTGAVTAKPGRFELANGGTLFLDEIGELPVDMQVKLLRVLQEQTFERVGGIRTLHVDIRLIAATNRDLKKAIADGSFREDLYWRLNVVPVELPPLRERSEDIPLLVEEFRKKLNKRLRKNIEVVSPEAMAVLQRYHWPGNIRELENIVERTLLFSEGGVVNVEDLPPDLNAKVGLSQRVDAKSASSDSSSDLIERLREVVPALDSAGLAAGLGGGSMKDIVRLATAELEKDLIARALDETQGNVTHAARRLKISRKSLQIKMKELGLRDAKDDSDVDAAPVVPAVDDDPVET